jgi:hypothetical protein
MTSTPSAKTDGCVMAPPGVGPPERGAIEHSGELRVGGVLRTSAFTISANFAYIAFSEIRDES